MKLGTRPFLFLLPLRGRSYTTQATGKRAAQKLSYAPQEAKLSHLPSGVTVASLENYLPISRVAVVYNAGARYEPVGLPGLTHCLRTATNLSTQKATAFGIARNLQQIGATLNCTTTREHMIYYMNCLRDDLATGVDYLGHVAVTPAFKSWEMESINRRLRLDLELLHQSPSARLMEALHKAAYRDSLGQSLYMDEHRIGTFTPADLESFVTSHYVSGNMAVAGVGVDHDTLFKLAGKLPIPHLRAPSDAARAKYHGGECRIDSGSNMVHAAIAVEGLPLSSNDLLALSLIQFILGTGPFVQHGSGVALSKLNKAISSTVNSSFAANCISSSYSDSGLFGVQVVASSQDIGKVLKAVVGVLNHVTKSGVTYVELQRAQKQLKARLQRDADDSERVLERRMASHALLAGKAFPAATVAKAVDTVQLEAVNKVAKSIFTTRPTMAAVGNLVNTPYLDELF